MTKEKLLRILKYAFLILIAFISVFPFVFMLMGTTSSTIDIQAGKMQIGDQFFTNMNNLFSNNLGFLDSLKNSAIIALITTVCALLVSSAAGYGFEVYKTKARNNVFNILLLSMMVPFAALMIPLFRMFSTLTASGFKSIGLDTFFSVIILSVSTAFLIFFFRQNVKTFPKDMIEAARVDGVSELGIFFKVFMPSIKNTYAAAAIITFMNSWNAYLWPLITLQTPEKKTVPLVLSAMGASYTPDYGMIMCAIVIATIPMAVIFFIMQKQFVEGMIGSVK